jgi:hypothetical protein
MMDFYSEARALYEKGDYKKAEELYLKGIEAGDPRCSYGYGVLLKYGYGVEKNEKEGLMLIENAFDDILRSGKKVRCIAADDMHSLKHGFGGWVCINADQLEYKTVMDALKKGDFYASTGPQIFSLVQENDVVKIRTSPCRQIAIITAGRRSGVKRAENSNLLTEILNKRQNSLGNSDKIEVYRLLLLKD